ncbi:MAG: type II toxin-antitoxin system Phd/YefM family antitoxin [Betaproteobacteria bacterium]
MKTLPLSEVKANLSGLLDDVEGRDEEVVITRNGRPTAVLISNDEYESWKETMAVRADKQLMRDIRKGLSQLKRGKARIYSIDDLLK